MDEWERYSRIFNLDKTEDVISQQHFLCHLTHGGGGGDLGNLWTWTRRLSSNASDLHSGRPWFDSRSGSPPFWDGTVTWAMPASFQVFYSSLLTIIQSSHYITEA